MSDVVFPLSETTALIPGPAGNLEIRLCASQTAAPRGVGVVCHPHPQFGGTMMNKVVTTVFKALLESGYHACRFNYRGVGKSEGEYDNGTGEIDDCIAVVNYLRQQMSVAQPLVMAGFSFGAHIAAAAAIRCQPAPVKLLSIAPAVEHALYDALPFFAAPWAVFIPEADEVVSAPAMHKWVEKRAEAIQVQSFANTSHFFHGELVALREQTVAFLRE